MSMFENGGIKYDNETTFVKFLQVGMLIKMYLRMVFYLFWVFCESWMSSVP